MKNCEYCNKTTASIKRPQTGILSCKPCFFSNLETEVHGTIIKNKLFQNGDKIAIGASGGKDSTVLAYMLNKLNKIYNYGVELYLLSVDEGIVGYRDDSLEAVKKNKKTYKLPLKIISYKDLYNGWTMDKVVKKVGLTNNCTFCGVFRRKALDLGSNQIKANKIVTGHNADDMAETVLMNILRGDISRLDRCVEIITRNDLNLPRVKPFKYVYEKEIVLYAHFKNLDYFSTECIYSPNSYRGYVRDLIKNLEKVKSETIILIIKSAEEFKMKNEVKTQKIQYCTVCGYISSNKICKACILLNGLNTNNASKSISNKSNQGLNEKIIKFKNKKPCNCEDENMSW